MYIIIIIIIIIISVVKGSIAFIFNLESSCAGDCWWTRLQIALSRVRTDLPVTQGLCHLAARLS